MSTLIFNNDRTINSVFNLIGVQENDISKSIVWLLKECPPLLQNFINQLCGVSVNLDEVMIEYQHFEKIKGVRSYTDIEIYDRNHFHIVIEAKRGWVLPGESQIELYSRKDSFLKSSAITKAIFSMSECSAEYAQKHLPVKRTKNGIDVSHISWSSFEDIVEKSRSSCTYKQRYLVDQFLVYLREVKTMSNKNSNVVYVVSLSYTKACPTHTCVDVVNIENIYWCPVKWFKNSNSVPNYLGFRYNGRLQYIRHVESYTISKNMHDVASFMPDVEWGIDHYIFQLGPKIIPDHEVRCGDKVKRAARVYADIDCLLTCNTITEAMQISKDRREK